MGILPVRYRSHGRDAHATSTRWHHFLLPPPYTGARTCALAGAGTPGHVSRMRTSFALVVLATLLISAQGGVFAQTTPAPPTANADPAPPATPAAPTAPAAEDIGVIEGVTVPRPNGGFLGLRTEGVVLSVTFYNKNKKPVPADAMRITARWHDTQNRNTVLLPSAPETLSSPGVIRRPFNYIVYFVLIGPEGETIENHSLRLAGS